MLYSSLSAHHVDVTLTIFTGAAPKSNTIACDIWLKAGANWMSATLELESRAEIKTKSWSRELSAMPSQLTWGAIEGKIFEYLKEAWEATDVEFSWQ